MAVGRLLSPVAAVVVALSVALATLARATPAAQSPQVQVRTDTAPPRDDVPFLGVSLSRMRRLLVEAPQTRPSTASSILTVRYHVDVVGQAPRYDFFKNFDIGRGTAVQYGGMTHDEFLRLTAPPWRRR